MLHDHHWTVTQANALRGWVAGRVQRLRTARDHLAGSPRYAELLEAAEPTGGGWPGREDATAMLELVLGFEALGRLDVVVRDLDRGLVDFPALRDGHEVYLCWLVDEPEVAYWHPIETGFPGRRPLDSG